MTGGHLIQTDYIHTAMFKAVFFLIILQYAECQDIPYPNHIYPYGTDVGDQMLTSDSKALNFGRDVIFSGKKYRTAYINKDGIISFGFDVRFDEFNYVSESRDPDNDPAFLAPFHFDGVRGNIYYRLHGQTDLGEFASIMQTYLGNATVGVDLFEPKMALIVTWENVTDIVQSEEGSCRTDSETSCLSSTFQVIMTASDDETMVIMSYLKMEVPMKPHYLAGINGGHGLGWTDVCTGCDLSDLPNKYSSSGRGGYIFRVTNDLPERGGCTDSGRELQIYPRVVEMFGGGLLEISGPCAGDSAEIVCKFGMGSTTVTSSGFMVNYMTYKCPAPILNQRGWVPVSVSVDGGQTFSGQGSIFVVRYGPLPKTINLEKGWYDVKPDEIVMTWDPTALSLHNDVTVDIKLLGYRENKTDVIWKELSTLATNTGNTGRFSFPPAAIQCELGDCELFEIGLVEVNLHTDHWHKANYRTSMNGGVLPLGWYVNSAMTELHGTSWPNEKCEAWYNRDRVDMEWMEKLLYCPCNVDQALADFGRWQPDVGCNIYSSSPGNCFYHKGAKHCVRSFQPSSTGAGNQCCYGDDGLLSYAADTFQGSTPDKAHDWGAYPYNKPGYVPSMSHWIEDVVTFYYCCLWNNYTRCDHYMDQRATRDCNGYKPSKAATAFGDPHLMTFDGKVYNFGGKGDFTLLKTPGFTLQGKFKQLEGQTSYKATVLTSVALQGETGDRVEVRLAARDIVSTRSLDVFVGGTLRMFNHRALAKQDFGGVSVINNNEESNYTVLLQSGVGVQVAESHGLLQLVLNIPPGLKYNTSGLLGTWNDNADDDFTTRSGTVVEASSTPEIIYNTFAKTWQLTEPESLFSFHNMAESDYVPLFTSPERPPGSLPDLESVCEGNPSCVYDYTVTGDRNIAAATRRTNIWFEELQSFQKLASTCGLLDVPYSTKDNYNYTLGNTVTVTGCRHTDAKLSGTQAYSCTEEEGKLQWKPAVNAKCKTPTPSEPEVASGSTQISSFFPALITTLLMVVSL